MANQLKRYKTARTFNTFPVNRKIMLIFFLFYLLHISDGEKHHMFLYDLENQKVKISQMYGVGSEKLGAQYLNMSFYHGESPTWDPDSHTLYWVDVLNQNIHAMNYLTFEHRVKHLDCGEVNVVIPVANSDSILIGCNSRVFVFNWNRNTFTQIAHLDANKTSNIFNEGKCDAYGRLWAGTKGPQIGHKVFVRHGTLYKVERPFYHPSPQVEHVTISNGMVWALNNSLLYYIDSATNQIEAFQFDLERGQLGDRRTILDTDALGYEDAIPDGITIDRDGFLWVALFHYGHIIRVDPDAGVIVTVYDMPVPRVTSMTWVGHALEDLVITTSKRNLPDDLVAEYPLAGSIFMLNGLDTGGVASYKFVYDGKDKCNYLRR